MARARNASSNQTFTCPECGRTFARAAALGAHRKAAHGVAGTSRRAASGRQRPRQATSANARRASTSVTRQIRTSRRVAPSSDSGSGARGGAVDRDRLLKTLFPTGIPASEEVIRAIYGWLDEAERLAQMK